MTLLFCGPWNIYGSESLSRQTLGEGCRSFLTIMSVASIHLINYWFNIPPQLLVNLAISGVLTIRKSSHIHAVGMHCLGMFAWIINGRMLLKQPAPHLSIALVVSRRYPFEELVIYFISVNSDPRRENPPHLLQTPPHLCNPCDS